jgi:signal peptidase I
MNFDFPLLLVILTFVTGGIWLLDALLFARLRRREEIESTVDDGVGTAKEPVLVEYARSFFPVILIVLLLRSFLAEPFRIPSGSMMPTLLVGDFILVNKFSYGIRLPVLNRKIVEVGEPQRGDVVVFRYPKNPSMDYIKRVIGVPGDQVSYRQKMLYINGKAAPQTPLGIYTGKGYGARLNGLLENRERIGERQHSVLINPWEPDFPPGCRVLLKGTITVPEGHFFVMGDNRDNSNDSRCWGLVPEENLVGKAFGIWMNWDGERSGFPIAWERLGDGIE